MPYLNSDMSSYFLIFLAYMPYLVYLLPSALATDSVCMSQLSLIAGGNNSKKQYNVYQQRMHCIVS